MSCHVMSCRHCCINSKKSFSKTFSFHKIIYKYFAGFLACIKSSLRGYCRSNPLYLDCFAHARNDGKIKIRNYKSHYEVNARDICGFQPADAPPLASNLFCADCHASLHQRWADACSARNDGKNIVITRFCKNRSNPQKRNFIILDCFAYARNDRYKKQNRTRCAQHGDDDNKNFQFDKFQRLLSVIYKKNSLTKEISK